MDSGVPVTLYATAVRLETLFLVLVTVASGAVVWRPRWTESSEMHTSFEVALASLATWAMRVVLGINRVGTEKLGAFVLLEAWRI